MERALKERVQVRLVFRHALEFRGRKQHPLATLVEKLPLATLGPIARHECVAPRRLEGSSVNCLRVVAQLGGERLEKPPERGARPPVEVLERDVIADAWEAEAFRLFELASATSNSA